MAEILIVDDDPMLCTALAEVLRALGHAPDSARTLARGLEMAEAGNYEVVILDVRLPDGDGLEALPRLRAAPGAPEVIILTGAGDADGAELAIRGGAWSYITKPPTLASIRQPVERAVAYRRTREASGPVPPLKDTGILSASRAMAACLERAARAARTDAGVLLIGATGTGKELFARAIHANSARGKGPFVVVDCAAIPEHLAESTLFGHERGAFTGAERRHEGLIRQADGGTLFLDEVGELPLVIQKALLRVLQERRFLPVGGSALVESDFRLVAATNRDLEAMTRQGEFREDLLFRLRTITIDLPPLCRREGDAVLLAGCFLERFCRRLGIVVKGMATDFVDAVGRYRWPGNVRELMGAVENALASAEGEPNLLARHLPTNIRAALARATLDEGAPAPAGGTPGLGEAQLPPLAAFRQARVDEAERFYLEELLRVTGGEVPRACAVSGLSRARLYALLKRHGLRRRPG
ncbi:sigma-54-dependent transcriptional regulator [Desulfocurvus vexinensis]|uniref:sigma-54-dependent transcriptional regulator n=1 Tax=Desulfocurvus vexinensis TaxID=399548 RepID=UPI00048BEA46|nr:sigma-54 dependent transcriptional regulator [Desulfocurvus vexinensis]